MKLETTDIFKNLYKKNPDLYVLNNEDIKTVQEVELEILRDILDICKQYKINYHLTGGSALGVVRHQGFIPWDDDIDIDIARKDLSLFLRKFRDKYDHKYWIHDVNTKGTHCYPFIHIRRKGTIFQSCSDPTPIECGICIDILVIENTFDNKVLRSLHGIVSLFLGLVVSCRRFYMNRQYILFLAKNDNKVKKVFKKKIYIGFLFSFLSIERWISFYDKWNSIYKNVNSKYVTVPTGKNHFIKETYLRKDFYESAEGSFEGLTVNIPKEIDKYLRHMYGDYMTIPSRENQEQHVLVQFQVKEKEGVSL